MKISFFVLASLAVSALSVPLEIRGQFSEWVRENRRVYKSADEHQQRLETFYSNLLKVAELNKHESHKPDGARFKLNKYADWTKEEMAKLRGSKGITQLRNSTLSSLKQARLFTKEELVNIPTSFDWRPKGVLAPIQDQGQCGSCWAFSTTSNVESINAIKSGGRVKKLSEQFLVDCDNECGTYRFENGCDSGCDGGLQPNAFKYIIKNQGQPSESSYPYQGVQGSCQQATAVSTISNWQFVSQDESQIAAFVAATAPVSIAVDAENWSFYSGGVMSSSSICPKMTDPANQIDHAVNIVGYGTSSSGTPYWIIRNSWNTDWGESGYGLLIRGQGFCGVNLFVTSSIA